MERKDGDNESACFVVKSRSKVFLNKIKFFFVTYIPIIVRHIPSVLTFFTKRLLILILSESGRAAH